MAKSVLGNTELMNKAVNELVSTYANMGYTADKAYGSSKFESAREQLQNIAQQQLLIQQQLEDTETLKGDHDDDIEDYKEKIAELGQQALEVINDMMEEIIGDSADGIASTLGNAFMEAFQEGTDAAKAWGDSVNDIVADIIKRMLITEYLEEPIGKIFDTYKSKWFPNGSFSDTGIKAIINSMDDFAADLNAVGDQFQELWDALPDSVRSLISVAGDAESAATAGIASELTEETGSEISGRLTATIDLLYSVTSLQSDTNSILNNILVQSALANEYLSEIVAAQNGVAKIINNNLPKITSYLKEQS
jgi:hypothetical protein